MEEYQPLVYRGHPMIHTGNNYFTLKSVAPYESMKDFSPREDPFNVLNKYAKASKEELIRMEDNEVQMYLKEVEYDKSGLV